ncbi:MAG: cell division protein SepF [bacterium]
MSGLVHKLKDFCGLNQHGEYDEEDVYDELYGAEDEYEEAKSTSYETSRKSNLKVVAHPNSVGAYEVKVIEPRSYEESLEIVNSLRDKKTVILNLHLLDAEQSQRIVDFLSGATHAIDGHQQRVGEGVFIFTPSNVAISAETEHARVIRDAFWNQSR